MKRDSKMKAADKESEQNLKGKEQASNILPLFWDLASLEEEKRIGRAIDLVKALEGKDVDSGKGIVHSEDVESDKEYALIRLVKGLSSSRKGARQGYATALVHLLTQFQDILADKVFDLMKENFTVKGSFKSQEERDAYFGQAFCYAAVYQAAYQGNLSEDKLATSVTKCVEGLLNLMSKKSFIQELCAKLIVDIVQKMDYDSFSKHVFPLLEKNLKRGWKSCSPEDLQILLAVEKCFKNSLGKAFYKTHWDHSSVCDKENFEKIAKVLMDSTITAHPRMHSVWKDVLPHAIKSNKSLKSFWSIVIEENLMQSSHERKFLALNVLQHVLPEVNKSQVEIIFSPRLMKSIFNGCGSEKNYLYSATKNFLASVPSKVAKNPNEGVALEVIHQLIGKLGNFQFDTITKTKTVESLIGELDCGSIRDFVSYLKEVYITGYVKEDEPEEKSTEDVTSQRRKWAITQLLTVTRNSDSKKEDEILLDVSQFLFFHAYFKVAKKRKSQPELYRVPDPAVDESVVATCRERFISVLGEISNVHHSTDGEKEHSPKAIAGTAKNGDFFAYHIIKLAKELLDDSKHITLNKPWTSEAADAFKSAFEVIENIRNKIPRDAGLSESRAFELIFLHTCLQLFHNTDEAADIIQELLECFKKVNEKKKKKTSDEEPHWSEVLTEILLSFLAQSSNLMRHVVNLVFSMVLPHVTSKALGLILEALGPKKNAGEGELELVHESDEEMGADEDESDAEISENEDKSDESSIDESDDESSNEEKIDEAFRTEIKTALGEAAIAEESDNENDDDDNEASDIDMDEVDPKLLDFMDKALAAAFNARSQEKSGKKKTEEKKKVVLHFRLRVLDVVETFAKKQPKNSLILELIEPLLDVVKTSAGHKEEQVIHDRAQGLLKNKIFHSREVPSGTDINQVNVHEQIGRLMMVAQHAPSVDIVHLVTQACMYLIRVLRGTPDMKEFSPLATRTQRKRKKETESNGTYTPSNNGMLDASKIVKVFGDALDNFMLQRNSRLQPVLFLELIKRYPVVAWNMAAKLPEYFTTAVNNFRKVQACEFLLHLLTKKTHDSEEEFKSLVLPLRKGLVSIFETACKDGCSMKARHFHEFFKVLDKFAKEAKKNDEIFTSFKTNELVESLDAAISGPIVSRSPQLTAYCKKILSTLAGSTQNGKVTKKKRKQESLENDDKAKQDSVEVSKTLVINNSEFIEPANEKTAKNKKRKCNKRKES